MPDQFSRTELLLGKDSMEKLFRARVAVFGIGGVGGYTVEALARSGIGTLDLIDNDTVCLTNLNRQIYALHNTIGKYKVDVAKERIGQINPEAKVNIYKTFYMPQTAEQFDFTQYDYVVDAIDTVTGKIALVEQAQAAGTPIISCMGAGNKMDATALEVADIYETSICPLARVMRRELKKRGIEKLKVVYSKEPAMEPLKDTGMERSEGAEHPVDVRLALAGWHPVQSTGYSPTEAERRALPPQCRPAQSASEWTARPAAERSEGALPQQRRQVPGSNAFVPAVAGLIIAGEVVRDLIEER